MAGVGKFEVLDRLGMTATGESFLARNPDLDRLVVIKRLSPYLVGDPAARLRFQQEAQLMARLSSPYCVRVLDYLEEDGWAWIVTELIEGTTLGRLLAEGGRMRPEQSLTSLRGALAALEDVHAAGLVHRDLRPETIVVTMDGTSKLADLSQMTVAGARTDLASGAAAYMSPELALGHPGDARSDLYSAGCVLYECLEGHQPFAAENADDMLRHHLGSPPPVAGHASPRLGALIASAMAKDPAGRPASAAAFAAELERGAEERYGADWLERGALASLVGAGGALAVGAVVPGLAGGGAAASAGATAAAISTGGQALGGASAAGGVPAAATASASGGASGAAGSVPAAASGAAPATVAPGAVVQPAAMVQPTASVAPAPPPAGAAPAPAAPPAAPAPAPAPTSPGSVAPQGPAAPGSAATPPAAPPAPLSGGPPPPAGPPLSTSPGAPPKDLDHGRAGQEQETPRHREADRDRRRRRRTGRLARVAAAVAVLGAGAAVALVHGAPDEGTATVGDRYDGVATVSRSAASFGPPACGAVDLKVVFTFHLSSGSGPALAGRQLTVLLTTAPPGRTLDQTRMNVPIAADGSATVNAPGLSVSGATAWTVAPVLLDGQPLPSISGQPVTAQANCGTTTVTST